MFPPKGLVTFTSASQHPRMPTTKSLAAAQAVQLTAICALMRTLPDEQAAECLRAFRENMRSLLDAIGEIDDVSDQTMIAQLTLIEKALQRG